MAKKRTHILKVRVTFDRACSITTAVRSVKDTIEGYDYFSLPAEDGEPETFKLTKISRQPGRATTLAHPE